MQEELSDMGSILFFRFKSETHGLIEELGRHSTGNSNKAFFCKCECESVEHVLRVRSEYSSIHKEFIRNLGGILLGLGDSENFTVTTVLHDN